MGSRVSSFKRGSGFLNNVDAVITGYTYEVGETTEIKKGPRKGQDFTPLSFVPSFRVDGADQDVSIRLLIGSAEQFGEVSEDGLTLSTPDGQAFGAGSEAGIFLDTLVKPIEGGEGFPDENFDEDESIANYEPIIGARVRLVNQVNEEKTKRQGKQVNKTTKKEYDRRDLKVARYYGQAAEDAPVVQPAKTKAAPAKTTGNGKASATTKPVTGKAAKDAASIESLSTETLIAILKKAEDNSLPKAKLSAKVLNTLLKHPQRDAVREYLSDDDNLAGIKGVKFDAEGEDQLIVLA